MFRGLQAKALHGYAWWLQCEKHLPLVEQLAHRLLKPRTHPQSALAHGWTDSAPHAFENPLRRSVCALSLLAESKKAALVPVAKYYTDIRGVRRSTGKQRLLRASQSCSQHVVVLIKSVWMVLYTNICGTLYMAHLRTYPVGFGNALADILKKMHEGVRGLRIGNVSQLTPMPFRNPYVCVYICI